MNALIDFANKMANSNDQNDWLCLTKEMKSQNGQLQQTNELNKWNTVEAG